MPTMPDNRRYEGRYEPRAGGRMKHKDVLNALAAQTEPEPQEVQQARAIIRAWELRNGHDAYAEPLDGGHTGYQGRCWDCDWRGPEHLWDEQSTPKRNAQHDAMQHRQDT